MATIKKILSPAPKDGANAALKKFLSSKETVHYNDVIPQEIPISTGSLILDAEVKVRSGQVIRLVGKGAELGKSSQALVFSEIYMETMANARTLYIKAEGRLSQELKYRSGLKFVSTIDEWETGTVFVLASNVADDIFDLIKDVLQKAYEAGEHICIIIDSVDGLILKDDYQSKGIGTGGMVAGVPKITKLFFRHCALPINHYDALCIMTGQYAAQISIDRGPNAPNQGSSSGGSSQQHQADYVFDYQGIRQQDLILEDPANKIPDAEKNRIIGKNSRITFRKSASDVTGLTLEVPIRKASETIRGKKQIWVEKEVCDLLIAYQIVEKSGSWFKFSPEIQEELKGQGIEVKESIQGLVGLYEYLEANEAAKGYFHSKLLGIISK